MIAGATGAIAHCTGTTGASFWIYIKLNERSSPEHGKQFRLSTTQDIFIRTEHMPYGRSPESLDSLNYRTVVED
jgi:hypothetical protein